jgi:hypothetical protein
MDQFGVQKPELKKIARRPELPAAAFHSEPFSAAASKATLHFWLGARVRELEGEAYSAFGVSKEAGGVHLGDVPAESSAALGELQADDLVQSINGRPVKRLTDLLRLRDAAAGQPLSVGIIREQQAHRLQIASYNYCVAETFANIDPGNGNLPSADRTAAIQQIHTRPDTRNEPPERLYDGGIAENYGPVFGNGVGGGAYKADLGALVSLAEVHTWSYDQNGNRGAQHYILFGSAAAADPGWDVEDRTKFSPIAEVDTRSVPVQRFLVTRIRNSAERPLGTFRWLVWVVYPVTGLDENTAYQEFQLIPTGDGGETAP